MIGEHGHTPEAIRARLVAGPRASYLRDRVYGGMDGARRPHRRVFFAIGVASSRGSIHPGWRTGAGTLAVGSGAAAIAYLVGWLLRGLVP